MQIKLYENRPVQGASVGFAILASLGAIHVQMVEIVGSLSFNNVNVLISQNSTAASLSVSLGLYSNNAGTLSIANSASGTTNSAANGLFWMSLATSATQNITPGNWFIGVMTSTAGNANISIGLANQAGNLIKGAPGGPLIRGVYATSQTSLLATMNTASFTLDGTTSNNYARYPYVIISA